MRITNNIRYENNIHYVRFKIDNEASDYVISYDRLRPNVKVTLFYKNKIVKKLDIKYFIEDAHKYIIMIESAKTRLKKWNRI